MVTMTIHTYRSVGTSDFPYVATLRRPENGGELMPLCFTGQTEAEARNRAQEWLDSARRGTPINLAKPVMRVQATVARDAAAGATELREAALNWVRSGNAKASGSGVPLMVFHALVIEGKLKAEKEVREGRGKRAWLFSMAGE